ncbi:MAG: sigma 54-dependent Fis family transcriptional regulator [Myxococcales bacterium]|nr:sigma 54-dependent Fis family transcriptional regulator [Myxococcales bacterium]
MHRGTTPLHSPQQIPVRQVRVRVLEGPDAGEQVTVDGETLSVGTAEGNDLALSDPTVSRYHLELVRSERGVKVTDLGSTNGTIVGQVAVERGLVQLGASLRIGRTKIIVEDAGLGSVDVFGGEELEGLRGRSPAMRRLMAQAAKVARTDASVLIVGESGVGKEVVARAIQRLSSRATSPYEIVDCGSLAPNLVASELFGHERGAFTGADRRHVGAFERAHGGTLFLDEVGELPAELQPTLLGALERRRFRRVGGREELAVDVRVLSATNRDLRAEVNSNAFRLDLYYRLAVVVLVVPPLRERPEDVPMLLEHFARELGHDGPIEPLFPAETIRELQRWRWPGNVRELRNYVEATLAMGEAPSVVGRGEDGAAPSGTEGSFEPFLGQPYKDARGAVLDAFERRYLPELLSRCEGNVSEAARVARMDRSYLFALLRKHGLR